MNNKESWVIQTEKITTSYPIQNKKKVDLTVAQSKNFGNKNGSKL